MSCSIDIKPIGAASHHKRYHSRVSVYACAPLCVRQRGRERDRKRPHLSIWTPSAFMELSCAPAFEYRLEPVKSCQNSRELMH